MGPLMGQSGYSVSKPIKSSVPNPIILGPDPSKIIESCHPTATTKPKPVRQEVRKTDLVVYSHQSKERARQEESSEEKRKKKKRRKDEEVVRSVARFLQEGVQPQLALPRRLRHYRNHHHEVFPWSHRGRCQELALRSEAQEVIS